MIVIGSNTSDNGPSCFTEDVSHFMELRQNRQLALLKRSAKNSIIFSNMKKFHNIYTRTIGFTFRTNYFNVAIIVILGKYPFLVNPQVLAISIFCIFPQTQPVMAA